LGADEDGKIETEMEMETEIEMGEEEKDGSRVTCTLVQEWKLRRLRVQR